MLPINNFKFVFDGIMSSEFLHKKNRKNKTSHINLILIILALLIISFFGLQCAAECSFLSSTSSTHSRQIGKSDVTVYTSDVSSAGLDVPDEYVDEVAMIQFSDNEPIEGESIIINATLFNVGTRGASVSVYFYDGPPKNEDLIGIDNLSIHALGYSIASTPWDTTGEDEFHTIYVLINPDDPTNESDNDNNQADRDIAVNQIPLANAGYDQFAVEDEVLEFDGTRSSDTQSDLQTGLIYHWNFNDPYATEGYPSTLSGNNLTNPTHIFTHGGDYEINLTVEDDGGAKAWDQITVTITNEKPIADIAASKTEVNEDEEIIFYSDGSWDTPSDLPKLTYFWDFGDGHTSGWINNTSIVYSFSSENEYKVKLTIKDDDNVTDSVVSDVIVNNLPPVADAGDDLEVYGSIVNLNGSGSWDTISDLKGLEYRWDFGDGEIGYGIGVTHEYQKKGSFEISLRVTDDNGEYDTDNIKVTINNLSPFTLISTDNFDADEDEELIFNASGSYDQDGSIIEYYWEFGDGESGTGMTVAHTYTESGLYRVVLTTTDNDKAIGRDSVLVEINNILPVANAGLDIEVTEGEKVRFDGSNSTDTLSDLSILEYYWDFGDNSTGIGKITYHTYLKEGIYTVMLKVTDDDNESAIHRLIVYVRTALISSIKITSELESKTCPPGEKVNITGTVDFEFFEFQKDFDFTLARIRLEIVETGDFWVVIPEYNGEYRLEITAPRQDGVYTVRASITRLGVFAKDEQKLTVQTKGQDTTKTGNYIDLNTTILIVSIGSVAIGTGVFTAGTDLGRFKFFSLLIPLFTRLNREAVLDNFTRGRIYEHIRMNPGQHYRAIKNNLELSNGSLTYHLKVLEKEDYIKSSNDGFCKRFYPMGFKVTKGQSRNIQELILEKIGERPFITQKELSQELGVDVSTVNYHINIMAGAGIIQSEKKGRIKHYYLLVEVEAAAGVGS